MQSLLDPQQNNEMIERINKLSSNSAPIWGKMNVTQMLKHSEIGLLMAFGDIKLKQKLIGKIFGKMAKRKLMADEPFGKNLPTDKKFKEYGNAGFEENRSSLINSLKRFTKGGEAAITKETHPFFGELTTKEWDTLQWKHLDHHLRQFGA